MKKQAKKQMESWKNFEPELKASILKGLKQAERGELTPHHIVWKRIKRKYMK